jgi:hypothetical protein
MLQLHHQNTVAFMLEEIQSMLEGESTPKENKKNKDVPIAMTL